MKKVLLAGILSLCWIMSFAQPEKLNKAIEYYYDNRNLDSALTYIEIATHHPATAEQANAWLMRGLIYKDIYKERERNNRQSLTRNEAAKSLKKYLAIGDTSQKTKTTVLQILKFIASTCYNDASLILGDSSNYKKSIESLYADFQVATQNFERYKEVMMTIDPNFNVKQNDIEFYNSLATSYLNLYDADRTNKASFLDLSKAVNYKVLNIDSNNFFANYNIGIVYYNEGVNTIKKSDYDMELSAFSDIQDESIILFKKSLPYMEKAYRLKPDKKEALIGLEAIYFALNDSEKSSFFRNKLNELDKQK